MKEISNFRIKIPKWKGCNHCFVPTLDLEKKVHIRWEHFLVARQHGVKERRHPLIFNITFFMGVDQLFKKDVKLFQAAPFYHLFGY